MAPNKQKHVKNDNSLPIRDLLYVCAANWHWFLAALVITLSAATLYILVTPPTYVSSASILIKDNESGGVGGSNNFASFSESQNSNAAEELKAMRSPATMAEAVKRLQLDVCYTIEGKFHNPVIYGAALPAKIKFLDLTRNDNAGFTMHVMPDSAICLWSIKKNGELTSDGFIRAHCGDTINTTIGRIATFPGENISANINKNIFVKRTNINETNDYFLSQFSAGFESENTTIVKLSIKDISTVRGRDILQQVIDIYNENWLTDKNQIAVSTAAFLDNRIKLLQQELWKLDGEISTKKIGKTAEKEEEVTAGSITEKEEAEKKILALNNQLQIVQYLTDLLKDKKNYLLPGNIGLENANVQQLVTDYNATLLRRNSVAQNSSDENPIVIDYDNRLAKLKETIIVAADNEIEAINAQLKLTKKFESNTTRAIASSPEQAKKLQSIQRQQKVKNALYLFLLQKREENALSKEYVAINTRVISQPTSSWTPIAPMKKNAIMMALAIGLLLPTMIIFFKEVSNSKVRGRKDLEGLTLPFVGEIPMYFPEDKKEAKEARGKTPSRQIVVKEGKRDVVNEAFRVLRANLRFITGQSKECKVIILTSFNPGSGKTFLTMNIAASLAIKGEKVLVIDGDMRHSSASAYVGTPKKGMSNYLSGDVTDIKEIIVAHSDKNTLHVVPVGTIPPNPTELLNSSRFKELVQELRSEYNYIFIDCPPIDIVADTQIIEAVTDYTLFVVRTGLLERSMLGDLEELYESKRFRKLAVILNGTYSHGDYHKYSYSYRYGYHNGRSYSYGQ